MSPLYPLVARTPAPSLAGMSIASLLLAMTGAAGAATLSAGPGKT